LLRASPRVLPYPTNYEKKSEKNTKTVDRLGKRVYTYYYVRLLKKAGGIPAVNQESSVKT
jgi:hypothetical protein